MMVSNLLFDFGRTSLLIFIGYALREKIPLL